MSERMWTNRYSCKLLEGDQNDIATWENSLVASYNVKHIPHDPIISILDIYPREMKHIADKSLYVTVYSFIQNRQIVETMQSMSIIRRIVIYHIYTMEYYSAIKRNKVMISTPHK